MTSVNCAGGAVDDVSVASLGGVALLCVVGSRSIMDTNTLLCCLLPRQLMVYLVTL